MALAATPEEWGERYAERRGAYDDLRVEIIRLLDRLLADEAIDVEQMESRTKSVESFVEKIHRKNEKYGDPVAEVTDLAAVRIIAYFPADVVRIGELVAEHFTVDPVNSRRQTGTDDPDRFGYRSDHYVVALSADRLGLPEYRRFIDLRAEIQVRTVMQHAWAGVDHRFRYKKTDLPPELQRRLYRLSALLEVADEQFAAIKQAGDALEAAYSEEVERGDLSADIDVLSLQAFLDGQGIGGAWVQRAAQAGFVVPHPDMRDPMALSRLTRALRASGIRTLAALFAFVVEAEQWGQTHLSELADVVGFRGGLIIAEPSDVLTFLALRDAEPSVTDELGFRPDITAALHQLNRHPSH
jgi:putative GTP pyrophosphokinase